MVAFEGEKAVAGSRLGAAAAATAAEAAIVEKISGNVLQRNGESVSAGGERKGVRLIDPLELSSHRSPTDAWLVVHGEVYDVTHFLGSHPGGDEIILKHLEDEDAYYLMKGLDKNSDGHVHSKATFEMLQQFHVGRLSSKSSVPAAVKKVQDDRPTAFEVDVSKPIVLQVGYLGEAYNEWVHQAIITKDTPFFFENKLLEFNTRTVWWVIPLVWLPVVCWAQTLAFSRGLPLSRMPTTILTGVFLWSFLEYFLHRFLFHIKTSGYWTNTLHYLLHGCHHKFPLDGYRLVFPPAATSIFCVLFWNILKIAVPGGLAASIFGGGLLGYVMYDLIHYFLHHGAPFNDISQRLKSYHLNHHFKEQTNSFGITSSLWDWAFDTLPHMKVA